MYRRIFIIVIAMSVAIVSNSKTLIAYYSYTNNIATIVSTLQNQIEADIVRIEPAEKGLDYAANNYAIGSALIQAIRNNPDDASSYPAIDPIDIDLSLYDTFIIAVPLWWSQMAAPMQTFLFQNGSEMANKNIGLIVSSASSGISGVESDAKRLIPQGSHLSPSLWIRSSQVSNAASILADWLNAIDYDNLTLGINKTTFGKEHPNESEYYNLSGVRVPRDKVVKGIYIEKKSSKSQLILRK